jgi:uncharacterized protein (DUF427 family)
MRAIWNGATIAQSNRTIVVEGNHYFPPESVDRTLLRSSRMRSLCPWKGVASYYHVQVGGERSANAAWTYRHPCPWIRRIKDRIAFWNGVTVVPD